VPDQRTRMPAEPEVPEHIMSWWIGLLEGAAGGSHPVFGSRIEAKLDEQTLVVSGALPSEAGRRDLERELRMVAQRGQLAVRNDTTVAPEGAETQGLLEQTLVAIYDGALHAKLAVEQIKGNPLLRSVRFQILAPRSFEDHGAADGDSRQHVAPTYRREVQEALAAGQFVVVATVDETDAFILRELLDEDTRSRRVLVMPPIVAGSAPRAADAPSRARP
jgi:hypothetical protein